MEKLLVNEFFGSEKGVTVEQGLYIPINRFQISLSIGDADKTTFLQRHTAFHEMDVRVGGLNLLTGEYTPFFAYESNLKVPPEMASCITTSMMEPEILRTIAERRDWNPKHIVLRMLIDEQSVISKVQYVLCEDAKGTKEVKIFLN